MKVVSRLTVIGVLFLNFVFCPEVFAQKQDCEFTIYSSKPSLLNKTHISPEDIFYIIQQLDIEESELTELQYLAGREKFMAEAGFVNPIIIVAQNDIIYHQITEGFIDGKTLKVPTEDKCKKTKSYADDHDPDNYKYLPF